MQIFVTIQLGEGETIQRSASELAAQALTVFGGDPATDTCQVAVTATANAIPIPTTKD